MPARLNMFTFGYWGWGSTTRELVRSVDAIIVESGGAIDVKSAREQGSTFTIYLPRSEVARRDVGVQV